MQQRKQISPGLIERNPERFRTVAGRTAQMLFNYGYEPVGVDKEGAPVWDGEELRPLAEDAMRSNPVSGNSTLH